MYNVNTLDLVFGHCYSRLSDYMKVRLVCVILFVWMHFVVQMRLDFVSCWNS